MNARFVGHVNNFGNVLMNELAASFSTFFHDKILAIKTTLVSERSNIDPTQVLRSDPFLQMWSETDLLSQFRPVTNDEVLHVSS